MIIFVIGPVCFRFDFRFLDAVEEHYSMLVTLTMMVMVMTTTALISMHIIVDVVY